MYEAKILKYSVSNRGVPLISFEVEYPHSVHKDVMTHRWARNFQSFRAVPPEVLLEHLRKGEYFIPEVFGHRTKGMGQHNKPVEGQDAIDQKLASQIWEEHVFETIDRAERFLGMGMAKQQINFLLQDLCFIRGIITTTMPKLENFFGLRLAVNESGDPVARPEVHKIALMMYDVYEASTPQQVGVGGWHLPLVSDDEISWAYDNLKVSDWPGIWAWLRKVSVGRCARVSYLTHDGVRDPEKDVALHDRLLKDGHMSPFEHQGTPIDTLDPFSSPNMTRDTGSFGYGWTQYRKLIPGEDNYYELQRLNAGE
jgi:thymidylate synthase ThyX